MQSKLISILRPGHDEIVVDKDRFCAFSGNDLKEVLHSGDIKYLVMAGVWTSGVILSTFTLAADEDYSITILSDACADRKASLHEELMTNLFPCSATVLNRRPMNCFASGKGMAKALPQQQRAPCRTNRAEAAFRRPRFGGACSKTESNSIKAPNRK